MTGIPSVQHRAWLREGAQEISIVVRTPEIYCLSKFLVLSTASLLAIIIMLHTRALDAVLRHNSNYVLSGQYLQKNVTYARRLEKEMAIHSSILAWRIPWTEESGRLQAMGSQELDMTWSQELDMTWRLKRARDQGAGCLN